MSGVHPVQIAAGEIFNISKSLTYYSKGRKPFRIKIELEATESNLRFQSILTILEFKIVDSE